MLQGTWTYVLQDAAGNIELTHSVSAGLDYAAIGPEHAMLREQGRVELPLRHRRRGARRPSRWLARSEGILPALESAHAIAAVRDVAAEIGRDGDPRRQPLGPRRQGRAPRAAASVRRAAAEARS